MNNHPIRQTPMQVLRRFIRQIDHFEVKAADEATKRQIERQLSGTDPQRMLREVVVTGELRGLLRHDHVSDDELQSAVESILTLWATSAVSDKHFEKLKSVAVVLKASPSTRKGA